MSKFGDFFKHFKDKYDEEQKRLMRMDRFLDRAERNNETLQGVVNSVEKMSGQIAELQTTVDDL